MKKSLIILLSVILLFSLTTACNSTKPVTKNGQQPVTEEVTEEPKTKEPQYGGTVTYAYIRPFKGLLDRGFYQGQDDDLILNFMIEGLLTTGDDLKTYPYIADWTESPDHKTFTFTLKKGIKWHNGDELTVEDWKYALEVIAHPDYNGSRYYGVEMIVGADAYHKGEADSISGIKVIDPYTIEITVNEAMVNTIDNLWPYPMPSKYYAGIAVKDLPNAPQVRQNPIGTGPFKVKKIQPGEFVELERFDDYWQGKPYLDGVVYKIIDANLAEGLLQNGEVDIMEIPPSQYKQIKELTNINLFEEASLGYAYIGFDFGHWDAEQEKVVMDNPKFQDKKLRQAMAYAIDRQAIIEAFSNGLGEIINAPMPVVSWAKAPDSELNAYEFNPEKARKLLDEAGYKDVNGDGLREDPQGNKLTINFHVMSGSDIAEPRAQAYMQMWHDVGLDVVLNGGSLKEFNLFYDMVENDDPSIDIFMGAWGLASDPDPTGLWRSNDSWNFPRWYTEESDNLIKEGIGEKAFDSNYRKEVYVKWQKIVNEELPMIFLYAPVDVYAANKRLNNVHTNSFTSQVDPHLWWVSE